MANKFKRWLIRKLGGFEITEQGIPKKQIMEIHVTIPMDTECAYTSYERQRAIEEIGKAVLDGNLAERTMMTDKFMERVVVRYKFALVKKTAGYIFRGSPNDGGRS